MWTEISAMKLTYRLEPEPSMIPRGLHSAMISISLRIYLRNIPEFGGTSAVEFNNSRDCKRKSAEK